MENKNQATVRANHPFTPTGEDSCKMGIDSPSPSPSPFIQIFAKLSPGFVIK